MVAKSFKVKFACHIHKTHLIDRNSIVFDKNKFKVPWIQALPIDAQTKSFDLGFLRKSH